MPDQRTDSNTQWYGYKASSNSCVVHLGPWCQSDKWHDGPTQCFQGKALFHQLLQKFQKAPYLSTGFQDDSIINKCHVMCTYMYLHISQVVSKLTKKGFATVHKLFKTTGLSSLHQSSFVVIVWNFSAGYQLFIFINYKSILPLFIKKHRQMNCSNPGNSQQHNWFHGFQVPYIFFFCCRQSWICLGILPSSISWQCLRYWKHTINIGKHSKHNSMPSEQHHEKT